MGPQKCFFMMVIILTIIIWEIVKWGVRKVFDKIVNND